MVSSSGMPSRRVSGNSWRPAKLNGKEQKTWQIQRGKSHNTGFEYCHIPQSETECRRVLEGRSRGVSVDPKLQSSVDISHGWTVLFLITLGYPWIADASLEEQVPDRLRWTRCHNAAYWFDPAVAEDQGMAAYIELDDKWFPW